MYSRGVGVSVWPYLQNYDFKMFEDEYLKVAVTAVSESSIGSREVYARYVDISESMT